MYMQPSTKGSACEMIFHKKTADSQTYVSRMWICGCLNTGIVYFPNFSITEVVTPVLENPPSWKRFCIVTYRVRSENRVMQ
jgi:hypothetical protein